MPTSSTLVVLAVGHRALNRPTTDTLLRFNEATGLDLLAIAREEGFQADLGQEIVFRGVRGLSASRLVLVGMAAGREDDARRAGALSARLAESLRAGSVSLAAPVGLPENTSRLLFAQAFAEGFQRGAYRFDAYRTTAGDDDPPRVDSLDVLFDEEGLADALRRGQLLGDAVNFARDLVNEPAHRLTPAEMARRAQALADDTGLEAQIFDPASVQEKGFDLLWAVGKASQHLPHLIHLVHRPAQPVDHKIALVGKGVTFDTGGYSIKTGTHMQKMHMDMAGGAAVLGAAHALARIAPARTEVHFVVPAAENAISGGATRPQDIIRGYGGKTVEILNTDAEGRLILADALVYAQEQGVDTVVDVATLTGSSVVALGVHTSALFSDDDALADALLAAAADAGDGLWRMPLTPEIDRQLDTPFADMKNIGDREGGAISAALFLKRWVDLDRWAHLDIAGPALATTKDAFRCAGATGAAVGTLVRWVESLDSAG